MTIYVAAINGRGVAAFHAEDGLDAENRAGDRAFRDDLMVLATGGLPLWDGIVDIQVRPALSGEEAKWRASHAKAIRHGNIAANDDTWIAFLVPLASFERDQR
jgi:hypothetical protein